LGAKRTSREHAPMSAFDPKRTSATSFSCDAQGLPFDVIESIAGLRDVS
jgi:hypothetical protein